MSLKILLIHIVIAQLSTGLSINADDSLIYYDPFLYGNLPPNVHLQTPFPRRDNFLRSPTFLSSGDTSSGEREETIPFRPQLLIRSELPKNFQDVYRPQYLRSPSKETQVKKRGNKQSSLYPEKPPRYAFDYYLNDDHSGNNYGHQETRDGHLTRGSYFVHLPDGRKQIVTYHVKGDSGFRAKVSYEGEARLPPRSNPSDRLQSQKERRRSKSLKEVAQKKSRIVYVPNSIET